MSLTIQSEYGSFYANGRTYDLLWVSSKNGGTRGLDNYLGMFKFYFRCINFYSLSSAWSPWNGYKLLITIVGDSGWHSCGPSGSCVRDCSALMVNGAEGAYSHTVVGIKLTEKMFRENFSRFHPSTDYLKILAGKQERLR